MAIPHQALSDTVADCSPKDMFWVKFRETAHTAEHSEAHPVQRVLDRTKTRNGASK